MLRSYATTPSTRAEQWQPADASTARLPEREASSGCSITATFSTSRATATGCGTYSITTSILHRGVPAAVNFAHAWLRYGSHVQNGAIHIAGESLR